MTRKNRRTRNRSSQAHQKPNAANDPKTYPALDQPSAKIGGPRAPDSILELLHTRDRNKRLSDRILLILTAMTALGGVIASIASIFQTYIARDAEIVSNRAFLLSNSVRIMVFGDTEDPKRHWRISPIIENTGNTQTANFRVSIYVGFCGHPELSKAHADNLFDHLQTKKSIEAHGIIGPKSDTDPYYIEFDNALIECPTVIDSLGIIKYKDIFGRHHITEYCNSILYRQLNEFKLIPRNQYVKIQATPCTSHNCADEECGKNWEERARE